MLKSNRYVQNWTNIWEHSLICFYKVNLCAASPHRSESQMLPVSQEPLSWFPSHGLPRPNLNSWFQQHVLIVLGFEFVIREPNTVFRSAQLLIIKGVFWKASATLLYCCGSFAFIAVECSAGSWSQVHSLGLLLMDIWAGCSMGSLSWLDVFLFTAFDECPHLCGWVCYNLPAMQRRSAVSQKGRALLKTDGQRAVSPL